MKFIKYILLFIFLPVLLFSLESERTLTSARTLETPQRVKFFLTRRKTIQVYNSTSALTGFQVEILLDYDSDMNTDFEDLRFTNGSIAFQHYIDTYSVTQATAYVKVPLLPAESTTTIIMYYDNPYVNSGSNTETFEVYDDFDEEREGGEKNSFFPQCGYQAMSEMNHPAAIYSNDRTFITFHGSHFDIYAMEYNHITADWSRRYVVADNPLTSDSHGAPIIIKDGDDFLHIFYGAHEGALKHRKSRYALNISSWLVQNNVMVNCTYPNAFFIEPSTITLFYRAGPHTSDWRFLRSSDNGATWGIAETWLDSTATECWYVNFAKDSDNNYHVAMCTVEEIKTGINRYNTYYVKKSSDNVNWFGADGTVMAIPITRANLEAESSCFVSYSSPTYSQMPYITVSSDTGVFYLLFSSGSGITESAYSYKFASFTVTTGEWSIVNIGTDTNHILDCKYLDILSDTTMDAYLTTGGDGTDGGAEDYHDACRGGNLTRWRTTDSGQTWTLSETIIANTDQHHSQRPVRYGNADSKFYFCAYDEPFDANFENYFHFRAYLRGASAFIRNTIPYYEKYITNDTLTKAYWQLSRDGVEFDYLRCEFEDGTFTSAFRCDDYSNIDDRFIVETRGEFSADNTLCISFNTATSNEQGYIGLVYSIGSYNLTQLLTADYDHVVSGAVANLDNSAPGLAVNTATTLKVERINNDFTVSWDTTSLSDNDSTYTGGYMGLAGQRSASSSSGLVKYHWFRIRKNSSPMPIITVNAEETGNWLW